MRKSLSHPTCGSEMIPSIPEVHRLFENRFRAAGRNLVVTFPTLRTPSSNEVLCWYTAEEKLTYVNSSSSPVRVSSRMMATLVTRKDDVDLILNLIDLLRTDLYGSTLRCSHSIEKDRGVFLVVVISPADSNDSNTM